MTGPQLKALREARDLTQAQLSDFLGDSTPGTVSRWEKGVHEIPQWVEDKLLGSATLTLPLDTLRKVMSMAADRKMDFEQFLGNAIRDYAKSLPDPDVEADKQQ